MLTENKANRLDIEFNSNGDACAAWLYLPATENPAPVLIMAHGLGGVRSMRLDAFAERFCAAGYACLVFDYRYFGDSGGQPRQLLNINKQLQDWTAAVAFARRDSLIDGDNIIVWGTSFSGGHALRIAATLPGVAGVIAQCPFTDGLSSTLALNPVSSFKVSMFAIADVLTSPFKKQPVKVPLVASGSQMGLMTASDAMSGYHALKTAVSTALQDHVSARFAFDIIRYYPGRNAKNISCPALIVVALKDSVAPAGKTLKHVKKINHGDIVELDAGHFDIYVDGWFEKNVAIQIDWLKQNFPTAWQAS